MKALGYLAVAIGVFWFPVATGLWIVGHWDARSRDIGTGMFVIGGILLTAAICLAAAQHVNVEERSPDE